MQNNENGVPYNGTLFAKKANYRECQGWRRKILRLYFDGAALGAEFA